MRQRPLPGRAIPPSVSTIVETAGPSTERHPTTLPQSCLRQSCWDRSHTMPPADEKPRPRRLPPFTAPCSKHPIGPTRGTEPGRAPARESASARANRKCGRQESNLHGPPPAALDSKGFAPRVPERVSDSVPFDSELDAVVRTWASLPAAVRSGIAAMVKAAAPSPSESRGTPPPTSLLGAGA